MSFRMSLTTMLNYLALNDPVANLYFNPEQDKLKQSDPDNNVNS